MLRRTSKTIGACEYPRNVGALAAAPALAAARTGLQPHIGFASRLASAHFGPATHLAWNIEMGSNIYWQVDAV
jgi:hypothetical protein